VLRTAERSTVKIDLKDPRKEFRLEPGEYEMQVVYHARTLRLMAGVAEDVKSNVLRFKVE
jgi:hypothetical protein